ncbi:TonB-dependent receptor [Oleispira antarctica RB-8]|uniref:TonB-dependent receptor n=1 Tax=Oleispira antarctica RB-8 TaxID=698738 RepID=R4YLT3_OLEAN|nr:TonB-dependent receptor [Oleispira antarctica RB-8]
MKHLKQSSLALAISFASNLLIVTHSQAAGINSSSDIAEMSNITISGNAQMGGAVSASMGTVVAEQIAQRPISRAGEILETVPGLIVTQHSGEGKANQYFLRGFNLDHGTDMATFIDGMPVNNRTHAHGQGYTDINFIIPEMIESLDYSKGPYYGKEGDFANAGAVRMHSKSSMDDTLIKIGFGQFGYQRVLLAGGTNDLFSDGDRFIAALDTTRYDGPWDVAQEQEKYSAMAKYTFGNAVNGGNISFMGFDNTWTATDQVPQRYIDNGGDRYDSLDDTTGGDTHRYSVSYEGWHDIAGKSLQSNMYAVDYGLDLFSNYTYAIDPVNGDQIRQYDERKIIGGSLLFDVLPTAKGEWQLGMDVRHDNIGDVSLSATTKRDVREVLIRHKVEETGLGLFLQNNHNWTNNFRTQIGARIDYLQADVENRLTGEKSDANDSMVSPKFNAIYSATETTHIFFNYGQGYHSNDARGFSEGSRATNGKADVFARSEGADIGVQSQLTDTLQLAASLWWLTLDSELVFVGDNGETEASDKSERKGVEASIFWQPQSWLIIDSDVALSQARLQPSGQSDQYIPGAIERVFSLGVAVHDFGQWDAGLRLRHFGDFALNEDNSERADAVTMLNAQLGYDFTTSLSGSVEVLNITNEEGNDITYLYDSRLPAVNGNPAEVTDVEDVHLHPTEPRMVRASLAYRF